MTRWLAFLAALLLHTGVAAANCDTAKMRVDASSATPAVTLYQQGMAALQADNFERADLLFRQSYVGASSLADRNEAEALARAAVARLVETALAAGDLSTSYFRLRLLRSLKTANSDPWIEQVMLAADAATVAVPEQPATLAALAQCRSIGVAPKADIRILFDYDSSELTPASRIQVRNLANAMALARVEAAIIRGHTDRHGDEAYNLALSVRRAAAVVAELIAVNPAFAGKLKAEGVGKTQPLYTMDSEEADRLNRRVELVMTGK